LVCSAARKTLLSVSTVPLGVHAGTKMPNHSANSSAGYPASATVGTSGSNGLRLMLHAGPDASKIDRIHPIEVLGRLIGRVAWRDLNPGVVECHIEPTEAGDRTVDHRSDLSLIGHIAADSN
jgi:hypothetical protein